MFILFLPFSVSHHCATSLLKPQGFSHFWNPQEGHCQIECQSHLGKLTLCSTFQSPRLRNKTNFQQLNCSLRCVSAVRMMPVNLVKIQLIKFLEGGRNEKWGSWSRHYPDVFWETRLKTNSSSNLNNNTIRVATMDKCDKTLLSFQMEKKKKMLILVLALSF